MIQKIFEQILYRFPQNISFAFAYGSGVFSQNTQHQTKGNMIDFIFAVDDPLLWHKANMSRNNKDYSLVKFSGVDFVSSLQQDYGAKIYFNTLIKVEDQVIKYGVISTKHLIEDLLDWQTLYTSGRLHKPVKILKQSPSLSLKRALNTNLQSALHASLLCLPESFPEEQLFLKVAGLSYQGDFRIYFGEDRRKVHNIVKNQLSHFRNLYADHLKAMPLLHWDQSQSIIEQDYSYASTLYHLNLLPRTVQHNILVQWNKDGRHRDMEDVLQALAHDPECCEVVEIAIRQLVFWPTLMQSAKGILTAGLLKSLKYSSKKLGKMFKSLYKNR